MYPSFSSLSEYRRWFSGYKTSYSKITIKLGPYQFKSPSLKIIKEFDEDEKRVEEILDLCFIKNQVMWQDVSYEAYYYYLKSLESLTNSLKKEIDVLSSSLRESDQFYSGMLTQMSKYCSDAIKRVRSLGKKETYSKGLKYLQPDDQMIEENVNMRKSTYSMIRYLIDLLPEGNKTKQRAISYLRAGEKVLTRIYGLKPLEITEPEMILVK
jgi:hypothetical protein